MKSIYLVFVFLIVSLSAQAEDFSLDQLMLLLGSQSRLKAQFREEKIDNYLEIPMILTGEVSFVAPDYLEKTIQKPSHQSFVLNGDKITISTRKQEAKTYSLEQHPEVRAFSASFISTLSGDLKALQRYYDIKLSGHSAQWEMQLKPINKSISRVIEKIQFSGQQGQLMKVTTWHRSGDYSVMEFLPVSNPDSVDE